MNPSLRQVVRQAGDANAGQTLLRLAQLAAAVHAAADEQDLAAARDAIVSPGADQPANWPVSAADRTRGAGS